MLSGRHERDAHATKRVGRVSLTCVWVAPILHRARRSLADLAELAFPGDCPACGVALVGEATPLCFDCQERIAEAAAMPCCPRCAAPLPDLAGPCGRCAGRGVRPFAGGVARLTPFDVAQTRQVIHAIKYGHRWPLVEWLAEQLLHSPRVRAILDATDVIVPVPLHWRRRFGRGFNQAELLGRALAHGRPILVTNAVRRVRSTSSQTAFSSRAARRRNLLHAFRLHRRALVDGRRVLIVDDVMTSGSTLQAVARAIKADARPASLAAIVVANANPLRSDLVAT